MRRQPLGASAEGPRPVAQARATPLSWIARLKAGVASSLQVAAECGVGLLSLAGVPVMVFTGKLFAAAVLAVIALGVFLRFAARRGTPGSAATPPAPLWLSAAVALLTALEVALAVEATGLPVRHGQPGFSQGNWLWVLMAFAGLFWGQRRWLNRRLARRRGSDPHGIRPPF
ncbi:hypothetical protein [Acidovorax sp. BLS4]|uniref:hypothetical protein n=1 Tax=Acidovorax sp. BLS4 TaxID=3273430 RepID=UPI002942BEFA|nr:hypothetical protein [Paracidovorax avenae]WOI46274.1 hypothetical protein R1Z03_03420 [Paracidovorax avenae]